MKTFKDAEGTEWSVDVNTDTIQTVRDLLDIDLLQIGEDAALHNRLCMDPVFLVNLLYVVCKQQADERKMEDRAFGRRMKGDAIDSAVEALIEELVNYFPKSKRTVLQKAVDKAKAVQALAMERAVREIDGLDVEKLLVDAIRGSSSTNSPASSASTPDHLRSAS